MNELLNRKLKFGDLVLLSPKYKSISLIDFGIVCGNNRVFANNSTTGRFINPDIVLLVENNCNETQCLYNELVKRYNMCVRDKIITSHNKNVIKPGDVFCAKGSKYLYFGNMSYDIQRVGDSTFDYHNSGYCILRHADVTNFSLLDDNIFNAERFAVSLAKARESVYFEEKQKVWRRRGPYIRATQKLTIDSITDISYDISRLFVEEYKVELVGLEDRPPLVQYIVKFGRNVSNEAINDDEEID